MNFKEIGVDARNWVDSSPDRDYCKALVNVGPQGSLNHELSYKAHAFDFID